MFSRDLKKTSSRQWRKFHQLNTLQSFAFFICSASAKCSALFWKVASSCLFPRPWDERTLQVKGFIARRLRQCAPEPICGRYQGGPQHHGNSETCSQWWTVNSFGWRVAGWTGPRGQLLHLPHWGNTCYVYVTRLFGGSNGIMYGKCVENHTEHHIHTKHHGC